MAKFMNTYCLMSFIIILNSLLQATRALPSPQPLPLPYAQQATQQAVNDPDSEVEELESIAGENEKDDLNGAASLGYGYYSYPSFGSYYGGIGGLSSVGYYPHYYGYGLGYPYYGGGYYGGHHGYHGYHGHYY